MLLSLEQRVINLFYAYYQLLDPESEDYWLVNKRLNDEEELREAFLRRRAEEEILPGSWFASFSSFRRELLDHLATCPCTLSSFLGLRKNLPANPRTALLAYLTLYKLKKLKQSTQAYSDSVLSVYSWLYKQETNSVMIEEATYDRLISWLRVELKGGQHREAEEEQAILEAAASSFTETLPRELNDCVLKRCLEEEVAIMAAYYQTLNQVDSGEKALKSFMPYAVGLSPIWCSGDKFHILSRAMETVSLNNAPFPEHLEQICIDWSRGVARSLGLPETPEPKDAKEAWDWFEQACIEKTIPKKLINWLPMFLSQTRRNIWSDVLTDFFQLAINRHYFFSPEVRAARQDIHFFYDQETQSIAIRYRVALRLNTNSMTEEELKEHGLHSSDLDVNGYTRYPVAELEVISQINKEGGARFQITAIPYLENLTSFFKQLSEEHPPQMLYGMSNKLQSQALFTPTRGKQDQRANSARTEPARVRGGRLPERRESGVTSFNTPERRRKEGDNLASSEQRALDCLDDPGASQKVLSEMRFPDTQGKARRAFPNKQREHSRETSEDGVAVSPPKLRRVVVDPTCRRKREGVVILGGGLGLSREESASSFLDDPVVSEKAMDRMTPKRLGQERKRQAAAGAGSGDSEFFHRNTKGLQIGVPGQKLSIPGSEHSPLRRTGKTNGPSSNIWDAVLRQSPRGVAPSASTLSPPPSIDSPKRKLFFNSGMTPDRDGRRSPSPITPSSSHKQDSRPSWKTTSPGPAQGGGGRHGP